MKKLYAQGALSALLLLLLGACKPSTQVPDVQPNIVFFVAEDLSPDLGCYGNKWVKTPHLDALAAEGMRFRQALVVAPVCAPSRTALATGMYPQSIGAFHMRYPEALRPALPDSIQTLPQLFKAQGYATANIKDKIGIGKYDWLFAYEAEEHFDVKTWQALAQKDAPFFAMLCTGATHRNFEQAEQGQFPIDSIPIPSYYPDHQVTRNDFADYYASIEKLDRQFGQVLDSLSHYGLRENTIIVFIGDHGRPMSRDKNYNYLSGLKVPMIISIPENLAQPSHYQAGKWFESMVSSIDVSAAMLDMANIPSPVYVQGHSFWNSDEQEARKLFFSATNRIGESNFRSRSLYNGRYHYIRNYHRDFSVNSTATAYRKAHHPLYHLLEILGERGQLTAAQQQLLEPFDYEELYDSQADPEEIHNLAEMESAATILAQMRQQMDSVIVAIKDQGLGKDSPEIEAAFHEYGVRSAENQQAGIQRMRQQVLEQINAESK